jgi:acyl dehydratase
VGLYYEDLEVGAVFRTQGRTVTEADVVAYSGLSGDFNPLHTDEEYCRTTPFGTRIAHGPLVLAIGLGLIARLGMTDGTSLGFLGIEGWRVTGAVKPGDTVAVELEITAKRLASRGNRGILTRHFRILNQRRELVHEGTMITMIASRGRPEHA